MNPIYILVDYKGRFSSKASSYPYRSGMEKEKLRLSFMDHGYNVEFLEFSEIDFRKMNFKDKYIIINSSEDHNLYYKDYIEDILIGLMLQGANLIPSFKYFRAHSNKVFMEILRDLSHLKKIKNISSTSFGTIEEFLNQKLNQNEYVIKPAIGAVSKGVSLGKNKKDIIKKIKKISRSRNIFGEIWDFGRFIKHKGYKRESKYRKKFIIQNFIKGLENDWKILIFGNKYFILFRQNRDNDFRASGSGKLEFRENIPDGILDFSKHIFDDFDVPNLSIDVGFDGFTYYLIEFQAIYFGTTTIEKSPFYFTKENSKWVINIEKSNLEKEYVNSIIQYIRKNTMSTNSEYKLD